MEKWPGVWRRSMGAFVGEHLQAYLHCMVTGMGVTEYIKGMEDGKFTETGSNVA